MEDKNRGKVISIKLEYLQVWDIQKGTCMFVLNGVNGHRAAITSLQFLSDGLVATSSDDGTVKLWDIHKGIFIVP